MKFNLTKILIATLFAAALSPTSSNAGSGDLYVSDNVSISKFNPGGAQTVFAFAFKPRGMAFDAAGDLFVSIGGDGTVAKFTADGIQSTFAVVGGFPSGLDFDSAGNLYVAATASAVHLITPDGTSATFFQEGFCGQTPFRQYIGVAVDSEDNVYVADAVVGVVYKFDPCGTRSVFASLAGASGLAFDESGNLFVSTAPTATTAQGGKIVKIAPDGTQSLFVSGLGDRDLRGLAFDVRGNIFVADRNNGTVYKITPNRKISVFAGGLNFPQYVVFEPASHR